MVKVNIAFVFPQGENGARQVLEILSKELKTTMTLTGVAYLQLETFQLFMNFTKYSLRKECGWQHT